MTRTIDLTGVCPSNYKTGTLIMNRYRPIDLVIFMSSVGIALVNTILMFYIFKPTIFFFFAFIITPPTIGFFLIQPFPNYHNLLVYGTLYIKFQMKDKYFTHLVKKSVLKDKHKKSIKKGKKHEEENNEVI